MMVKSKAAQAATKRFEDKAYDKALIRFPAGTLDRIRATGYSINGLTVRAVLDRLNEIEDNAINDNGPL